MKVFLALLFVLVGYLLGEVLLPGQQKGGQKAPFSTVVTIDSTCTSDETGFGCYTPTIPTR